MDLIFDTIFPPFMVSSHSDTGVLAFMEDILFNATVASKVISRLREEIIIGRLSAGTHITIKEIAEAYKVSFMPVREAFRALEGERLLEIVPYKGAIVKRIDEDFIRDMFGALSALEVYMTEAAMKRIGEKEIQTLLDINAKVFALQDTPEDVGRYLDLNTAFHSTIFAWSGNAITQALHKYYHSLVRTMRSRYRHPYSRIMACAREHDDIIRAMQTKNTYLLKSAVDKHMEDAQECLLRQYSSEN